MWVCWQWYKVMRNLNVVVKEAEDLPEELVSPECLLDLLLREVHEAGVLQDARQVGGCEWNRPRWKLSGRRSKGKPENSYMGGSYIKTLILKRKIQFECGVQNV